MSDVTNTIEESAEAKMNDDEACDNKKCDLDLILDIPLKVRAELGQVRMLVNDLLQLGQGSILELEKKVGDQIDIYISDKLIARGEVVVVEEKFGIRLTDIISPDERIKTLA